MSVQVYQPDLRFTIEAWKRLSGYLQLSEVEISGFGRVIPQPDGSCLVDRIYLLKQTVSDVSTEIHNVDVDKFTEELIVQGENPGFVKFWWHSHGKLQCFWSQTDVEAIQRFNQSYLFSLVGNHRGDAILRLDVKMPALTLDDIKWGFDVGENDLLEECQNEMRQKVSRSVTRFTVFKRH